EAHGLAQVRDAVFLSQAHLMKFFVADERVGNIPEGTLNGLTVGDQRLPVFRLGQVEISLECTTGKDGLADMRSVGPDAELRAHHARTRAAASKCPHPAASERDLRKKSRFRHANFGIRSYQDLFRLANVGTPLE